MRPGLAVATLLLACSSPVPRAPDPSSPAVRLARELTRATRDLEDGYRTICRELLVASIRERQGEPFSLNCVSSLDPDRIDLTIIAWPDRMGPDSVAQRVGERMALTRARQELQQVREIGATYLWEPTDQEIREIDLRARLTWSKRALERLPGTRRALEALTDPTSSRPRRMNAFVDATMWGYDWCLFYAVRERSTFFVVRDPDGAERNLCTELRGR